MICQCFLRLLYTFEKILSDMAPNFSGDKDVDHMAISVLNALVLKIAMHNLKVGGSLLMKTLQGSAEKTFFVVNMHLT